MRRYARTLAGLIEQLPRQPPRPVPSFCGGRPGYHTVVLLHPNQVTTVALGKCIGHTSCSREWSKLHDLIDLKPGSHGGDGLITADQRTRALRAAEDMVTPPVSAPHGRVVPGMAGFFFPSRWHP